jgi:predicted ATPase/DNA-binding winged helix-turn-helix (wHTH) protein
MKFADYELKVRERQLIGPAGPVELSGRSFDILVALLNRPNELVDKSELFDTVWPGVVVEENTLQVHVSSLRKLLGQGIIATVHGRGYKYVGPLPRPEPQIEPNRQPARVRGNIPDFRTECVNREHELAALADLLTRNRTISILGPGGVGKTTLAVETAARQQSQFSGGAWIVDLAPVADPLHVASTVMRSLDLQFPKSDSIADTLAEYLRNEDLLLVIDNCEHLVGGVRDLVATLTARTTRLRILLTSQAPLGLESERIFKLTPFGFLESGEGDGESPSAQFFRHCYESYGESVAPSERAAVARLCRNLDGVALALKMAAARAATLGIAAVERQIMSELAGLSADWPTSLPRHRSLMAALAWSHGLLDERERRAFRALSVFSGSFSMEAAAAATGEDQSLPELVRKSLVVRDASDRTRYRLLETSRHFARDHLIEHGEIDEVSERHADFVVRLLAASLGDWEKMADRQWLDVYGPDTENLRAALTWVEAQSRWLDYARLCAGAWRLWLEAGLSREGLAHFEQSLKVEELAADPELAAALRLGYAELCRTNSLDAAASQAIVPALQFYADAADTPRLAQSLCVGGQIFLTRLEVDKFHAMATQLTGLLPHVPASKLKARMLIVIGKDDLCYGDIQSGLAKCEAGLAMHRATGNTRSGLRNGLFVAEMLHFTGNTAKALAFGKTVLQVLDEAGYRLERGYQQSNLCAYCLALGQFDQARELLLEAVETVPRDDIFWHWALLQNAAALEAATGDPRRAARLLGYLDFRYGGTPDGRQNTEQVQRNSMIKQIEAALPAAEITILLSEGAALSPFEADYLAGFPVSALNRNAEQV